MTVYHVKGDVMMKVHVSFDTGFAPGEEGFFDLLKEEAEASFFDWALIRDISGLDIRISDGEEE